MPTATATRPRTRSPTRMATPQRPAGLPRVRNLDLSPRVGPWHALGHSVAPPPAPQGFGPPRFTAAQQAANPGRAMTRLVKDVLPVGRWKVGINPDGSFAFWNVDEATLRRLAESHHAARSRGVAMNLTKSHGDVRTGMVPTDELIAPVDQLIVEGGRLWASVYVTPAQAAYLQNPACKVSPCVHDGWSDGGGHVYDSRMIHVAVTDNPVVPGQGPFLTLANRQQQHQSQRQQQPQRSRQAAFPARRQFALKGKTMDLQQLIPLINSLLTEYGAELPADTSEATLIRDLQVITATLGLSGGGGGAEADFADAGIIPDTLAMTNRNRSKPAVRKLSNTARRAGPRATDAQCHAAAVKFFGVNPRKPA